MTKTDSLEDRVKQVVSKRWASPENPLYKQDLSKIPADPIQWRVDAILSLIQEQREEAVKEWLDEIKPTVAEKIKRHGCESCRGDNNDCTCARERIAMRSIADDIYRLATPEPTNTPD